MKARRTFLAALALLAARAGRAQAPARRIGYLSNRAGPNPFDAQFDAALRERGYAEGRDVAIDRRYSGGDFAALERMVAELVALRPDVLVVSGPAARYAARATRTIPIVAIVADPVGQGLAASLARPGGNVTGLTLQSTDLARKRLQLLQEVVPGLRKVAVLAAVTDVVGDAARRDAADALFAEAAEAARRANVALLTRGLRSGSELPEAFARFRREQVQALIVQAGPLTYDHRRSIFALAADARLPSLYEIRNYVDDGGLLSYGPDLDAMYRRVADYVDRILRGATPAQMAIEQPGRFELVVNLATANAMRLAIPADVLRRADDVIR